MTQKIPPALPPIHHSFTNKNREQTNGGGSQKQFLVITPQTDFNAVSVAPLDQVTDRKLLLLTER
jgi:hypothetical protein